MTRLDEIRKRCEEQAETDFRALLNERGCEEEGSRLRTGALNLTVVIDDLRYDRDYLLRYADAIEEELWKFAKLGSIGPHGSKIAASIITAARARAEGK